MDNRHGLIADVCGGSRLARGLPPREATVGADTAYDHRAWVHAARQLGITPHVAQKPRSAIDGRTTRHAGYAGESTCAQARGRDLRLDEDRGGEFRKVRHRGGDRVEWHFLFVAAAYNLVRLRNLPAEAV